MKDCKWNPPTALTKGQHFGSDGKLKDRAALAGVKDGERMLKFLDTSGDRASRRRARRQVAEWIKRGEWEPMLRGEIDPPAGWALHIRDADQDTANLTSIMTNATRNLQNLLLAPSREDMLGLGGAHSEFVATCISLSRQGRLDAARPGQYAQVARLYPETQGLGLTPAERVLLAARAGEAGLAVLKPSNSAFVANERAKVRLFLEHGLTGDVVAAVDGTDLVDQLATSADPASDVRLLRDLVGMRIPGIREERLRGRLPSSVRSLEYLRGLETLADRRSFQLALAAWDLDLENGSLDMEEFEARREIVKQGLANGGLAADSDRKDVLWYLRDPRGHGAPALAILINYDDRHRPPVAIAERPVGALDLRGGRTAVAGTRQVLGEIAERPTGSFDCVVLETRGPESPDVRALVFAAGASVLHSQGALDERTIENLVGIAHGTSLEKIARLVAADNGEIGPEAQLRLLMNGFQHEPDIANSPEIVIDEIVHYTLTADVSEGAFALTAGSTARSVVQNIAAEIASGVPARRGSTDAKEGGARLIAELTAQTRARCGDVLGVAAVPYHRITRDWDHAQVPEVVVALDHRADPQEVAVRVSEALGLEDGVFSGRVSWFENEVVVRVGEDDADQLLQRLDEVFAEDNRRAADAMKRRREAPEIGAFHRNQEAARQAAARAMAERDGRLGARRS